MFPSVRSMVNLICWFKVRALTLQFLDPVSGVSICWVTNLQFLDPFMMCHAPATLNTSVTLYFPLYKNLQPSYSSS
uniref:Uncharacterized protein n=1 Tax=Triticum urartu TaxID=4572 RepID=A0A8R7P732_TRIUA